MNKQFGRLEKIKNIRDIWDTEDRDFTPLLALVTVWIEGKCK